MPLRDEAGVSLGSTALPILFAASLGLTLLVSPTASALLQRTPDKGAALQVLYRVVALTNLGKEQCLCVHGDSGDLADHVLQTDHPTSLRPFPLAQPSSASISWQDHQQMLLSQLRCVDFMFCWGCVHSFACSHTNQTHIQGQVLTLPQRSVRCAFYLWVSLANLVGVASVWARASDVFSPEASARLFGILGAGATSGLFHWAFCWLYVVVAIRRSCVLTSSIFFV